MQSLETERLILRKFSQDDISDIYYFFSDIDTNKFLPWFPVKNLVEAQAFFSQRLSDNNRIRCYAICLKSDNRPIGYVTVSLDDSFDLGYGLHKMFWHNGYATEAVKTVIKQLHKEQIPYITATHDIMNISSGNVMKRLGMKYFYSYEEQWQPKNILVTFRMYQLNLCDITAEIYKKYWNHSEIHFIEKLT